MAADQIETLKGLLERVTIAKQSNLELDALILCALLAPETAYVEQSRLNGAWCIYVPNSYQPTASPRLWQNPMPWRWDHATITGSVDAALALVARVLPGWWVTSGLRSLSGHASIGPDYNGPEAERLRAEFPPERFDHGGFDADLKPGDGLHRQCLAILACLLSAKLALLTQEESNGA
jgi:hypothetical protein